MLFSNLKWGTLPCEHHFTRSLAATMGRTIRFPQNLPVGTHSITDGSPQLCQSPRDGSSSEPHLVEGRCDAVDAMAAGPLAWTSRPSIGVTFAGCGADDGGARPHDFIERDQALLSVGQIISDFQKCCQAPESKIFRFTFLVIRITTAPSHPEEGRRPSSLNVGMGCGGRFCSGALFARRRLNGSVRRSRVVLAPRRWC